MIAFNLSVMIPNEAQTLQLDNSHVQLGKLVRLLPNDVNGKPT